MSAELARTGVANVQQLTLLDSTSPTWSNVVNGQKNLYDAIRCVALPSRHFVRFRPDWSADRSILNLVGSSTSSPRSPPSCSSGKLEHRNCKDVQS